MGTPNLPKVNGAMSVEDLANLVAILIKELSWLLTGNLDVKNIRAKSITADRMNVNELSAISADLGHITAGLIEAITIVGSLIKTADAGQRIELSSAENLLKAIHANGGQLNITTDFEGSPAILFFDGSSASYMFALDGTLQMISSGDIRISPSGSRVVRFNHWGKLLNDNTGRTLQQELNDLSARISALGG